MMTIYELRNELDNYDGEMEIGAMLVSDRTDFLEIDSIYFDYKKDTPRLCLVVE